MYLTGFLCLICLGYTFAQDYSDDQEAREQHLAPNYAHQGYNHDLYNTARAEPYDFGFQSTDEFGTIMNRQESSDSNGAVRGSYGYTDPYGVFRHVDYVADEFGFRAEVKSNEPGMGTQSPANVQIYAEPPPAGVIVERPYYHQPGQGNQASGQQPSRRNPAAAASNSNANRQTRPVTRVPVSSNTRTAANSYVPPQQNAFASNALSGSSNTVPSHYPSTVSNQYAVNSAAAAASTGQYGSEYQASSSNSQYGSGYQASGNNGQYGSGYPASGNNGQYGSGYQGTASNSQYGSGYQASASSYPSRNVYTGGYSGQSAARSAAGSSSSSSSQQPIVAKPYDGPTYKIGNPHVTEFIRADKKEAGSILLPTVVTTGGSPTLIKHIHAYPAAPVA